MLTKSCKFRETESKSPFFPWNHCFSLTSFPFKTLFSAHRKFWTKPKVLIYDMLARHSIKHAIFSIPKLSKQWTSPKTNTMPSDTPSLIIQFQFGYFVFQTLKILCYVCLQMTILFYLYFLQFRFQHMLIFSPFFRQKKKNSF